MGSVRVRDSAAVPLPCLIDVGLVSDPLSLEALLRYRPETFPVLARRIEAILQEYVVLGDPRMLCAQRLKLVFQRPVLSEKTKELPHQLPYPPRPRVGPADRGESV